MEPTKHDEPDFFPSGAIAFFASVVVFMAIIWLSVYTIMLVRH